MSQNNLKDKKNKYPRDVELLIELLDMERNEIRKLVVDQVIPHLMVQESLLKELGVWLDTRRRTTDAPETATQENSLHFYLGADTDGQDDSGFTWICKCNIARHVISRCSFCGTYRPKITDEPDDLDPSPTPPVIQRP